LLVTITVALAGVAVLAAIVVVAVGGGGELSAEHPDHPPLALPGRRAVGGTDAALLRLPLGLWGYHKQITDEALERFAYELTERDTRIAVLEQELAEARQGRAVETRDRPRALPAGSSALPAGSSDVSAEPTDPPAGSSALPARSSDVPAMAEDPFVTRTDADRLAGADETAANDAGFARPDDPWKTIVDRPDEPRDAESAARRDDGE